MICCGVGYDIAVRSRHEGEIPKELESLGRVIIYASNKQRKKLLKLLEIGEGR